MILTSIFFVDSESRVFYSNRSARRLINGVDIKINNDKLIVFDELTAKKLVDALNNADGKPFTLKRENACPLIAAVHRPDSSRLEGENLVLMIRDPDARPRIDLAMLQTLFGFSAAEARFAAAIAIGDTPEIYARNNSLSNSYVKTLAKRAYARADVNSRADFVRRVLGSIF